MIYRLIIFLALNFAALALGGLFTNQGVTSEWYSELTKAPWTPPGWVFGTAWTTIMICFAIYMMYAWEVVEHKKRLLGLFALQWLLNVAWNPIFFHNHHVLAALFVISGLTVLIGFFLANYRSKLKIKSAWLIPYFIWLLIATSLNAYILFNN